MSLNNLVTSQLLVADTSPLLAWARVGFLEPLADMFEGVYVTQSVLTECLFKPMRADAQAVQQALDLGWLKPVLDPQIRPSLLSLDRGQQTALEFALQQHAVVLIDEKFGRQLAKAHQLKVIGAPGVLLLAKQKGVLLAVKPVLVELVASGYFLSDALISTVLELANER